MTKFPAVDFTMATNADSFAIGELKPEAGGVCPRFDMMGLEFAMTAAPSALVVVPLKYSPSPFCNSGLKDFSFSFGSATLPIEMAWAAMGCIRAFLGAILCAVAIRVKFFPANLTLFRVGFASDGPAFFGAIARGAIGFVFKFLATDFADMGLSFSPVLTPDRIVAIHRAKSLRMHSGLKDLAANLARVLCQFLNAKVVASNEFGRGEFAPRACRKYGLTASALAYIHSPHYTIYCAVMQARLQRMLDAFGIRGELVE